MKTITIISLLIGCFFLGSVLCTLSYQDALSIKKNFEAQYLHVSPYKDYISSIRLNSENNEFSIFVSLSKSPPSQIAFPQTFRGVKVVYKVEQVICTQEARICPDGVTYIGRTGPHCEFAPCPNNSTNSTNSIKIGFNGTIIFLIVLIFLIVVLILFAFICCCCALVKAARCRKNKCVSMKQILNFFNQL